MVSVVIPTFNGSKYIWRAIESVLNQTFTDYEIVISDNCSTDNTRDIVLKYAEKYGGKINYHRNERNIGYTANVRKLIYELSRGQYIAILCDDDYYCDRNALSYYVRVLEDNPAIGFAFANSKMAVEHHMYDFELCSDEGGECSEPLYVVEDGKQFFLNFGEYILNGYPLLSTLFIRRDIAEKAQIFVEDTFKYCPDLIAVQKMLLVTSVARINKTLVTYSWRPNNLSHHFGINEMLSEEIQAVNYMVNIARQAGVTVDELRRWSKKEKDRHASGKVYHVYWEVELGFTERNFSRRAMKKLLIDIMNNSFTTILKPKVFLRIILAIVAGDKGIRLAMNMWRNLKNTSFRIAKLLKS